MQKKYKQSVFIAVIPLLLGGCVAAAAPLMMAASLGVTGFAVHKTVQYGTGGEVAVAFPSVDGKEAPPLQLPPGRLVAVWPGHEREIYFTEALARSGHFTVTSPSQVSGLLTDSLTTFDLSQLTERERAEAFDTLCRKAHVDLVFAAQDLGVSEKNNILSFSRAKATYTANLTGYSCTLKTIAWHEQMAVIVEQGGKMPSDGERNQAAGEVWAERVLEARQVPSANLGAVSE